MNWINYNNVYKCTISGEKFEAGEEYKINKKI